MHEGHRERLKRRYIQEGLDGFDSHQALELLLFYGIPRRDTNELAHVLLKKFGSLAAVLEAKPDDLAAVPGIGANAALLLSLIPSMSRLYFKDRWGNRPILNSSALAGEFLLSLFAGRTYEAFYLICLDAQNHLNHAALVHEGTINEAPVYPRIIVETALRHQSNSVILAHNHPGGSLEPSSADLMVTRNIINALEAISIKVVDHIIIAGDRYISFAEKGLLK